MSYLDVSLKQLEHFEGCVPWMYLDSRGYVTVGVGRMLPDVISACSLPFQHVDGSPASRDEVVAAYNAVKAMQPGRSPSYYHPTQSVILAQKDIDWLLASINNANDATLRAFVDGYGGFPDCVKIALLDMAYNLGERGLVNGYPHLIAYCKAHDWKSAAANCHRNGPNAERNDWTKKQFEEAV